MQASRLQAEGEVSLPEITCASCQEPMETLDRFCRHCGSKRGGRTAFHDRPIVILGLLFLVIGPMALPLLWRSKSFTRNQKIGISIANLAFIGAIALGLVAVFRAYTKMILDLSGM